MSLAIELIITSLIIETSLAPSPIARVYAFGNASFTSATTYYFYFGETLATMTTLALNALRSNTDLSCGLSNITDNAYPLITKAMLADSLQ